MHGPDLAQLPQAQRSLVELLAAAQDNLSAGTLARALKQLKVTIDGKPPSKARIEALGPPLEAQELLVFFRNFQLDPNYAEAICRRLIREGRFERLAATVDRVQPVQVPKYHWEYPRQGSVLRELRRALVAADADAIRDNLQLHAKYWGAPDLTDWFTRPVDLDGISQLPGEFRSQVLLQISDLRFFGEVADPIAELAIAFAAETPTPLSLSVAAREQLLRGRTTEAARLLEGRSLWMPDFLRGWLHLQRGELKASVKAYAKGLATLRKQTRTRDVHPGGPEGLFLPLAYLLDGTKTRMKQARSLLDKIHYNADLDYEGLPPERALQALHAFFIGQPIAIDADPLHPVSVLITALQARWADKSLPASMPAAIAQADQLGWTWVAGELRSLQQADPSLSTGVALWTHRQVVPQWERRLDRLEQLAPKPGTGTAPSEPKQRIAWLLNVYGDDIHLEARDQKRTRKGWSVGRKIGNKRLQQAAKIEAMTPADLRIAATLRSEEYGGWRRYREVYYEWDTPRTWAAMAGHPHLFLLDDPTTRVEVVARKPQVQVRSEAVGLRLTMSPPFEGQRVIVELTRHANYDVTVFDDAAVHLARSLDAGLLVPDAGKERVGALLARLASDYEVEDEAMATQAIDVEADPRPIARLAPHGHGVCLSIAVRPSGPDGPIAAPGEGTTTLLGRHGTALRRTVRDLVEENRLANELLGALPSLRRADSDSSSYLLPDTEAALELLVELQALGDAVAIEWPEGETLRLRREVSGKFLSLSVKGSDQWFEASGKLEVDDGLVLQLGDLIEMARHRRGRFIQLEDGQFLALTAQLQRRLNALARVGSAKRDGVAVHRLASPVLDALLEEAGTTRRNKAYKRHSEALADLATVDPPATLQAELRPYQHEGFAWLARLAAIGAGGCLADDMGLGKTVQALGLLLHRMAAGPAVVVAPTSVCGTWLEQAWRFAPTLAVTRFGSGDRAAQVAQAGPGDVIVTSYGLLQSESELFASRSWATLVLDEAQAIKNADTQRHKAATALSAQVRLATTGTPIENHLGELWSLFSFLNPGLLGSEARFRERFATPIEAGDRDVAAQLRRLVLPFILRRTKSAVLQDLPAKTEITVEVDLTPNEAAFYEALRQRAVADLDAVDGPKTMHILSKLTGLRQACCSPRLVGGPDAPQGSKLRVFGAIVEQLRSNRHRALVFSQFVRHLGILRTWLDEQQVPYLYLDGSTPAKERDRLVAAFQQGEGDLFLISLRAGGSGLNLTAADYVVHMDPWWNPAVEDQASDRAHRIGQTRPVTVYRLVAKGTIEEKIVSLHHTKRDLSDQLLAGAESAAKLSPEQLLALLQQS